MTFFLLMYLLYLLQMGMTPLILAASANKLNVVQLLIEKNANVNSQTNEGHSSLQYAASKGWKQVT